ncbi:hypothetical protein CYMTET_14218 [Cymbomonas tetramitiformis]|uniref:Uncharacterized protein n=1 Tax=Cymbomonas tetramitiformis TaxID=36881 RepID=A0AAE0GGS2_9CHLO|nr:hypothetical protein CYMTET_14218 [Cymbomonas tetramitiformis]
MWLTSSLTLLFLNAQSVYGTSLTNLGGSGCTSSAPCSACYGDCDSDADCAGSLACFQRGGTETVPGCTSGGSGDISGYDYCYGTDITAVATSFVSSAASAIAGQLPNMYAFLDGTSGTCISDGGGDMYDCGNQINVMTASGTYYTTLAYRQSTTAYSAGSDITYVTYKASNVWLAAFSSPSRNLGAYYTSGNNGADGGGSKAYGYLGQSSAVSGYYGWYKQVYNAGDPSINELIITTDPSWAHSIGSSTDNGEHRLQKGNGGVSELYYLMWAGSSGYGYSTSYFTNAMNTFLSNVYTGATGMLRACARCQEAGRSLTAGS